VARHYRQGKFTPKHPEKYVGNVKNIVFRSSWELRCALYFDQHPSILQWSSEEVIVDYISPVDNRAHRYFVDFIIKYKDTKGNIRTSLIEVKPFCQTIQPELKSKRQMKRYITELTTWGINNSKWKSAKEFADKHGWEFRILTEKEIGI